MILDLASQMPYNDRESLLGFWGDHAMSHGSIARRLGSRLDENPQVSVAFGSGDVIASSIFDVGDQAALAQWAQGMSDPDNADAHPEELVQWLQAHQALHVAETQALAITTPFDLSVLDVRKEGQFLDWMDTHARLHKQEDDALGD